MTPEEIRDFVDELYGLTAVGDWENVAARLTEDFVVTEAEGLPMAGRYEGRNGLRDLYIKVMGTLDVVALDRVETTVGRDHAVTILSLRFADPSLPPAEILELFRFRDGKLAEIKPYYFDPAPVNAAARIKSGA